MSLSRVRLVLGLDIHDGKLSAFQTIAEQMVAATEGEAGTLTCVFLLSSDKALRLIETYDDASAIKPTHHRHSTATVAAGVEPDCDGVPWGSWAEVFARPPS